MKIIIVKTQAELYALPPKFDEYTRIEIHGGTRYNRIVVSKAWENSSVEAWGNSSVVALGNSSVVARGNSSVEARGNSSVVAWGNSSVVARENSSVELFIASYCIVLSSRVVIKKLLDFSTVVFRGCEPSVQEKSETSLIREIPEEIEPAFEEWLRRGYVYADGITKKLKSQKKIGEIEVFEVFEFPKKETSFVVKRGDTFSHGKTVEKAIEDLRYKIAYRDTSKFNHWKANLDKEVSLEEAIQAYRTITGSCEMGTKQFVESIKIPEKLTPKVIMDLTSGHFGSEKFQEFLRS